MNIGDTIHIVVTAEDIAEGKPNMNDFCPVALALKRVTGESYVSVIGTDHDWGSGYNARFDRTFLRFPRGVNVRITRFDHTGVMKPFEFDAEVIA